MSLLFSFLYCPPKTKTSIFDQGETQPPLIRSFFFPSELSKRAEYLRMSVNYTVLLSVIDWPAAGLQKTHLEMHHRGTNPSSGKEQTRALHTPALHSQSLKCVNESWSCRSVWHIIPEAQRSYTPFYLCKYNLPEDKVKFNLDAFSLALELFKVILCTHTQRFCISSWKVLKILLCHSKITLQQEYIPHSILQAFSFWHIL